MEYRTYSSFDIREYISISEWQYTNSTFLISDISQLSITIGIITGVVGLVTGIITIVQTYNKILDSFNQLRLTDELFDAKIESLRQNIERIDEDTREERAERANSTRNLYQKIDNLEEKVSEGNGVIMSLIKKGKITTDDIDNL